MPQRALWQADTGLLLVADLHLGKAESFQASGIPLPSDGDLGNLNQLLELAAQLQPERVVVLGDLIHSRIGLTRELREQDPCPAGVARLPAGADRRQPRPGQLAGGSCRRAIAPQRQPLAEP